MFKELKRLIISAFFAKKSIPFIEEQIKLRDPEYLALAKCKSVEVKINRGNIYSQKSKRLNRIQLRKAKELFLERHN